jgi:hypothetical protein
MRAAPDAGDAAADAAADDAHDGPLSPLAEAAGDDVAALEAHGLAVLKAELQRLGLKCGGTVAERARRLLALRGRTRLHAEDAALLPKARARLACAAMPAAMPLRCSDSASRVHSRVQAPGAPVAPPPPGAVRVPRQGPLLPGQQRTKLLKRTHD